MHPQRFEDLPPEVRAQVDQARALRPVLARLEAAVQAAGVAVDDLRIAMAAGTVVLTGTARSPAARDRAGAVVAADAAVGAVRNHIDVADPAGPIRAAQAQGDLPRALVQAERLAGSADPDQRAHGLFLLAQARHQAGDTSGAIQACSAAMGTHHPDWSYHALRYYAHIMVVLGVEDEARSALERLIELGHPEASVRAVDDLAALLVRGGHAALAEGQLLGLARTATVPVAAVAVGALGRLLSRRLSLTEILRALSDLAGRQAPGSTRRGVFDLGVATFLAREGVERASAVRAAQAAAANPDPDVRGLAVRLLAAIGAP